MTPAPLSEAMFFEAPRDPRGQQFGITIRKHQTLDITADFERRVVVVTALTAGKPDAARQPTLVPFENVRSMTLDKQDPKAAR